MRRAMMICLIVASICLTSCSLFQSEIEHKGEKIRKGETVVFKNCREYSMLFMAIINSALPPEKRLMYVASPGTEIMVTGFSDGGDQKRIWIKIVKDGEGKECFKYLGHRPLSEIRDGNDSYVSADEFLSIRNENK